MSVTLIKGQILTKEDLNIYIQENGNYVNPYSITYTIYRKTHSCSEKVFDNEEPLLETVDSIPIPFGIGKWFAPWVMPQDIEIGNYRIKWRFRRYADSVTVEEPEEFAIVVRSCLSSDAHGTDPSETYEGDQSC